VTETLLIIEDEPVLSSELAHHFRHEGWDVIEAATLAEARRQLFRQRVEPLVVLSDMSLPDGNALDLLEEARGRRHDSEWVFLTGYGTVADAVRGLRLQALDFLEKPCDLERLDLVLASASRSARAHRNLRRSAALRGRAYTPEAWRGRSEAARKVREMLGRLAGAPFSTVILEGETGTGKGLAARILHHSGARATAPLVEVNCAALPKTLLESELFGHEEGAFTGARGRRIGLMEQAQGGTLFLDEISEMDLELQSKLLSAVEEHKIRRLGGDREIGIDLQVIAASNRDLRREVAEGRFREDLYHRLRVFRLELPPLRERPEDLADLVPAFVDDFNVKAGKSVRTIPDEVWRRLRAYPWPGNVRELRNVVERCVLLADGEEFPGEWLQLEPVPRESSVGPIPQGARLVLPLDGSLTLVEIERKVVEQALDRAGGNVSAAARLLGTTRETLRYRVEKYGLATANP
jgi:two-component system response regulator AtoC